MINKEKNIAITEGFIIELFYSIINNKKVYIQCKENLKFEYMLSPEYKYLWKTIFEYNGEGIPTIGIIEQDNVDNPNVLQVCKEIRKISYPIDESAILNRLEIFILRNKYSELLNTILKNYKQSQENNTLISKIHEKIEEIKNFSIDNEKIDDFSEGIDFEARLEKYLDSKTFETITTGIDQLDKVLEGGFRKSGTTALIIAQSGAGKTRYLQMLGANLAFNGYKVLHFQLEGTLIDVEKGYDAVWSKTAFSQWDSMQLSEEKLDELKKRIKTEMKGNFTLKAFTLFRTGTIKDIRESIELYKINHNGSYPEVIIIDYMEKIHIDNSQGMKDNLFNERLKRIAIADDLSNIANEFKCLVVTATQAGLIRKEDNNDPNHFITREHISEAKAVVNPFSVVISFNRTDEERETNEMRIYVDKSRWTSSKHIIHIKQDLNNGLFYDREGTNILNEHLALQKAMDEEAE